LKKRDDSSSSALMHGVEAPFDYPLRANDEMCVLLRPDRRPAPLYGTRIMKTLRSTVPLVLLLALCASVASCADVPSQRYGSEAQGAPATTQQASNDRSAPKPALTIQAGEGEKLNLPWFVQDVTDWVNEGSASPASGRSSRNQ
jgi:hypothetical protein